MTILHRKDLNSEHKIKADICIIGGGVVGLSTALSLAKKNPQSTIALLESGLDKPGHGQNAADGELIGDAFETLSNNRIRALGGTQWVWGGHSRPLDPIDFEKRDWIEYSGWPISYEEFAQYIKPATQILDIDDYDWSDIHPEVNYQDISKSEIFENCHFKLSPQIAKKSKNNKGVYSFSRNKELAEQANLNIYLDHTVLHLNFNSDKSKVKSAVTSGLDGQTGLITAGKFILSAGGIENSRLMKYWFGREDAPDLACYDNVGRYFMGHPHRDVAKVLVSENQVPKLRHQFGVRHGTAVHMIRFKPTDQALRKYRLNSQTIVLRRKQPDRYGATMYKAVSICEQIPDPKNRIELGDEKDMYGIPKVKMYWSYNQQDMDSMNFVANEFPKFTGMNSIGRSKPVVFPLGTKMGSGHHHMGGTRMGENAKEAVVDSNCKLFDVDNFYVAGGSVFPTSGGVNPTINMLALSQRLVDHLTSQGDL